MDAMELYMYVYNNRDNLSCSQINDYCEKIRNASGDRAYVIMLAKTWGWWNQSTYDTCVEIMKTTGSRAVAICCLHQSKLWDDRVMNPCEAIRQSPGRQIFAIYWAKLNGWWDQDNKTTCRTIMNLQDDELDEIIGFFMKEGLWVDPT